MDPLRKEGFVWSCNLRVSLLWTDFIFWRIIWWNTQDPGQEWLKYPSNALVIACTTLVLSYWLMSVITADGWLIKTGAGPGCWFERKVSLERREVRKRGTLMTSLGCFLTALPGLWEWGPLSSALASCQGDNQCPCVYWGDYFEGLPLFIGGNSIWKLDRMSCWFDWTSSHLTPQSASGSILLTPPLLHSFQG